ncbi:MAG TPA: HEPN domain-containing protein [Phycisphaerales bacterium]|nr:HEPN domain-containing protein [Phycisphaerales bacterium]
MLRLQTPAICIRFSPANTKKTLFCPAGAAGIMRKTALKKRPFYEIEESDLTDIVCFHCQQCAEKYLKALLVYLGVHFPKTHDLRLLLDLVTERVSLDLKRTRVIPLSRYVIEGRYPGEWEPIMRE